MEQIISNVDEFVPIIISAFISLFCTSWIQPYILKVAVTKNIVDKPNARKLQQAPVPVLGGLAVVFGVLSGLMCFSLFGDFHGLFPVFASIIIIMIIGLIDDIISLSPKIRFVAEILLIIFLAHTTNYHINNFYGLWGIFEISNYVSIPLTIFACVGIINAINLIDGVDGYSSGYSIVSCTLFGIMFHKLGNMQMVALAAIVGASLVPFFIHNVFGKKSKMFIGDAGTLSLGIIFSVFVITILSSSINAERFINHNLGLIPFTLAVMCIPVADTLRVMSARILKGKSPFSPDKTHLHHLFIELGFNHISTALIIIAINSIVILCWFAAYKCGASIDVQLYLVIAMGVLATFILYPFAKIQIRNNTKLYQAIKKVAQKTHLERKGCWEVLQKIADWQIKDNISKS